MTLMHEERMGARFTGPDSKRKQRDSLRDDVADFLNNGGEITEVPMGVINCSQSITPSQQNTRSFMAAMEKKNGQAKENKK